MTEASARGCVYFVEGAGLVKVGWTTYAPAKRVRNLQSASPTPLVLLAALPALRSLERSLHERMAEWRRSGEWFLPNPVLRYALDIAAWIGWDAEELCEPETTHYRTADEVERFGRDLADLFDAPCAPRRVVLCGAAAR